MNFQKHVEINRNKWIYIAVLILGITIGLALRDFLPKKEAAAKIVTIKSRNLDYQVATKANTVGELLAEQGFPEDVILNSIQDLDSDFRQNDSVRNGIVINIREPVSISLTDGGESRQMTTLAETVGDLLNQEKIGLAATDRVIPGLHDFLGEESEVVIDRIVDLEVTEINEIAFAIETLQDPEIFYGRQQIQRLGEAGAKEQLFLITYKNGVEIRRKQLSEKILKKSVSEIRSQGTKIEVEAEQEGRASWYAYKNCMCAAHPSFAFGRFVRVTSLTSGKSVIVKINDRGPDISVHPERIIDLDALAYKSLAPLSSGTIGVKVELLK